MYEEKQIDQIVNDVYWYHHKTFNGKRSRGLFVSGLIRTALVQRNLIDKKPNILKEIKENSEEPLFDGAKLREVYAHFSVTMADQRQTAERFFDYLLAQIKKDWVV